MVLNLDRVRISKEMWKKKIPKPWPHPRAIKNVEKGWDVLVSKLPRWSVGQAGLKNNEVMDTGRSNNVGPTQLWSISQITKAPGPSTNQTTLKETESLEDKNPQTARLSTCFVSQRFHCPRLSTAGWFQEEMLASQVRVHVFGRAYSCG